MATLYDYKGYKVSEIGQNFFTEKFQRRYMYFWYEGRENRILFPVGPDNLDEHGFLITDTIGEHPELLDTAKSVYVHPNCDIPRDLVKKKYKRCLNPWAADVVVIPGKEEKPTLYNHTIITINEVTKKILFCRLCKDWRGDEDLEYERLANLAIGTKLKDAVAAPVSDAIAEEIKDTEIMYNGPATICTNKQQHYLDYMTYKIPKNNIVFQETLLKKLGDESNAPTYESVMSIVEMLNSNDEDIVGLGLKTLASIDYANYKQTVTTVLMNTSMWSSNKALTSSAVKCMFHTLGFKGCIRPWNMFYKGNDVTKEDYEIVTKLLRHFRPTNEDYLSFCCRVPFITVDADLRIIPNIVQQE